MALCGSLTPDQLAHFLVVSLDPKSLLKLVGRLGTVPRGTRVDTLNPWELAWSLTDYYPNDGEVAKAVDKALDKELGDPRLATAVAAEGGAQAVEWLLLESPDPARDLAWALLREGGEGAAEGAGRLIATIVADFDEMDERAKAEEAAAASGDVAAAGAQGELGGKAPEQTPDRTPDKELLRDSKRARTERDRALRRSEGLKERLAEVEALLAESRRSLKATEATRARAEDDARRAEAERDALKARIDRGLATELDAARAELETARRRIRTLEGEVDAARSGESALEKRLRTLESAAGAAKPQAAEAEPDAASAESASWSLPVFSDEFYDSIKRWDRKIIRIAFEKIVRLAEDWRHPSLRAIPLEGLPDAWRIRIASDVRLIYRPLDGGRVEILSLIDREDLQRYIRQAKSRPAG